MSVEQSEAQAEAIGRRLAELIERFSAEQHGLPRTCRLPRCRRSGRCSGTPRACQAELEAAVAAKRAALPPNDACDGLALVRQALLIALAQKEAEVELHPEEHMRRVRASRDLRPMGDDSSGSRQQQRSRAEAARNLTRAPRRRREVDTTGDDRPPAVGPAPKRIAGGPRPNDGAVPSLLQEWRTQEDLNL